MGFDASAEDGAASPLAEQHAVDELEVARLILDYTENSLDLGGCKAEVVQDLIVALMCPDPARRRGTERGVEELHDTPSLLGFDWASLTEGTLKSPLANRVANVLRAASAGSKKPDADGEAAEPDFDAA